ncbi:MAG: TolC family protein, partial [Parvularcula sp.]|nr:TolC family protein [Parvularcula sp.]
AETLLPWPEWDAPVTFILDGQALTEALEAENPELAMLERKVAGARVREEIARLERYPDLTLGLNYMQISDSGNAAIRDAGRDPWGFTVAVNIPLWRGKYQAQEAEAIAKKRASEYTYDNRLNALRADLTASIARLRDAKRRLELYGTELLSLAEQAVENSRISYQSGRTGILEVIDSERSLLDLQLRYWRAAADAWQEQAIIKTIVNQPLTMGAEESFE